MSQTHELSPVGSLEQEQQPETGKKVKSRRPPNTAFRQQRLKAWQPILTPKTVLPIFYVVGLLFALFGGLMLWASSEVQELALDYTRCGLDAPEGDVGTDGVPLNASRVVSHFSTSKNKNANTRATAEALWSRNTVNVGYGTGTYELPTQRCSLQFYIPNTIQPPIFLYYRLTNFYQNHRRYVKSVDMLQLQGDYRSNTTIKNSPCDPLTTNGDGDGIGKAYFPCGLIANSIFNDTIMQPENVTPSEGEGSTQYPMTDSHIGWSSDAALYGKTKYANSEVVPPPNWRARYPDGVYNDEFPIPNIHEDESFWVWMRTAGLPTFSKLARKNTDSPMEMSTYQIQIDDYFPVHLYGGTKEILISTRTVLGGKNPFLGIAYIVVAGICILLGVIFTAMNLIRPRKLGDHRYLSWNNDQPTTATVASGRSIRPNDA